MTSKFHGFRPKRKSAFSVLEQSTSFDMTNGELVENCIKAGYSRIVKDGDYMALCKPESSEFCYEFHDKESIEYADYLVKNKIIAFDETFAKYEAEGNVQTAIEKQERIETIEDMCSIFSPRNPFC